MTFETNLLYIKSTFYNGILLPVILIFSVFSGNTQESSNIKLRIEPGIQLLTDSENLSLILNIEPKIKISEHEVIGLRFGVAVNSQKIKITNSSQFFIDNQNDNAVVSFVPSYDYYFKNDKFRPYLGIGLGYYILSYVDVLRRNGSAEVLEGRTKNKIGALLRGGFEFGNTRLGLEYNFIPKADIEIPNGDIIGTINNSYLGVTIGFTLGRKQA